MDNHTVESRLTAARTKLILEKPFLGALVLRLPLVAAKGDWCPTTATDARSFYYNPEFIASLNMAQTQFILAHEALHCALSHFARRQHRVKYRWDLACDFAVNPLLLADGLQPPPDALYLEEYEGMTAEEIYPLLEDVEDLSTLDQHLYDQEQQEGGSGQPPPPPEADAEQRQDAGGSGQRQPGDQPPPDRSQGQDQGGEQPPPDHSPGQGQGSEQSDDGQRAKPEPQPADQGDAGDEHNRDQGSGAEAPPPLTPDERDTLQVQWQQRTAGAAQQAAQAGKLSGLMARMIDHLLQPQLPWRMLLARYMTLQARDDFNYSRPSRREGDAILPSLRSQQLDILVAVDTSGSIKQDEIDEFLAEVSALKGQVRARVTLLACDSQLVEGAPWCFEPWEEIRLPDSLDGGGGTDFRPVFNWVVAQGQRPDLLLYFTDAEGSFPPQEPDFPVLWLVKGKQATPWGQRIQLN